MQSGHTLAELLVVLTVCSTLCGIALPRIAAIRDRAAVRSAAGQVEGTLAAARRAALLRSATTSVVFDPGRRMAFTMVEGDTVMTTLPGADLAVALSGTRDTIRYSPDGRGYGATNSSVIVTRGAAADTIYVSRLGRVRS
ncbi:MAG TPA: GspH/FimT family pseudopilin [Gemmatimonadaceae bacterium]|jgi:Tfp pilus assembly protein FimT|nr:GspH/FimT family pseudopilin [Gemmatimonadaceae bacterium]